MKTKIVSATHSILPSQTDSAISIFNNAHLCYVPPSPVSKLHVFLPGSGANPNNSQKWLETSQEQGYYTIGLEYVNSPYQGTSCNAVPDPKNIYLDNFCQEVLFGLSLSNLTTVNVTNSVENRLLKLLQYLDIHYPVEGWAQFFDETGILWEKITISGHSQGGSHAAFLGKYKAVERVICVSSPREVCAAYVSTWGYLTNIGAYNFFTHDQDNYAAQVVTFGNMGVTEEPQDVEDVDPLDWGKVLITSRTSGIGNFHKCTLNDANTPKTGGIPDFKPVWIHLLINNLS